MKIFIRWENSACALTILKKCHQKLAEELSRPGVIYKEQNLSIVANKRYRVLLRCKLIVEV